MDAMTATALVENLDTRDADYPAGVPAGVLEPLKPKQPVQAEPVRLSAGELLAVVQDCAKASATKGPIEVLKHLELSAAKGWLTVTGSDGETLVRRSVQCNEAELTALVPAKLLAQTVKQLLGKVNKTTREYPASLALEHELIECKGQPPVDKYTLIVEVNGRSMKIAAMLDDSFPAVPAVYHCLPGRAYFDVPVPLISLPAGSFRHCLDLVSFAAVKDSYSGAVHYTNGVFVRHIGNKLDFVATDGHRLALKSLPGFARPEQVPLEQVLESIERDRQQLRNRWDTEADKLNELVNMTLAQWQDQAQPWEKGSWNFERAITKLQDCILATEKELAALDADGYDQRRYDEANSLDMLLPARSAELLAKMLPKTDETAVHIYREGQVLWLAWDEITLQIAMLDVKFPPYERVISKETKSRMHFYCQQLADCLKAAELIAKHRDANPVCFLSATGETATLSADGGEHGSYSESIPVEVIGQDIKIAINPHYVVDVLKALNTEQANIAWVDEVSPVRVETPRYPDFTYIVMPIRMD